MLLIVEVDGSDCGAVPSSGRFLKTGLGLGLGLDFGGGSSIKRTFAMIN